MATKRLRLRQFLDKKVHDSAGECAGRLQELRAEARGRECHVTEYILGKEGLAHRLSIPGFAMTLLRPFGAPMHSGGHRVPWHQMDLSDPAHPRLRCTLKELEAMQPKD